MTSRKAIFNFVALAVLASFDLSFFLCEPTYGQQYDPSSVNSVGKGQQFLAKGLTAFKIGDYQAAVLFLKQAQNADHQNKKIAHMLALAYSEAGDNYNAAIGFRSALSLDHNYNECRNNYGIFLKKTGKLDEAKSQFKECIKIKPTYPEAHYNLGTILRQQGDLDAAIDSFRAAIRINPRYFEAQRDLGLTTYEKFERGDGGDISDSLEKLQTAERLVPYNPMIHYHLGNIYCAEGDLDAAELKFRKALANDPKLASAHYELARLRFLRGDPNRALFELKAAQKISPTYSEGKAYPPIDRVKIKTLEGKCEELTGDYAQAIEAFKDVASLTANNAQTLKHINELVRLNKSSGSRKKGAPDPQEVNEMIAQGIRQTEQGDLQGAKDTFSKVLELDPKNFIALQNRGLILDAEGNLDEAGADYQQAVELKPRYEGLYYNFGYFLERLGRKSEAGLWYKRFHDIAGKYPYDPKHIVSLQQDLARESVRKQR
jgi:Tfp pilus assembly protein PilF